MKLHRKIEHNDKVCWAQILGYYAQGQGHNHVRCQIELKIRSEMTSYVLCKTDSVSLAVFKVTARDQGHNKGTSGAFVTYCNSSCFVLI